MKTSVEASRPRRLHLGWLIALTVAACGGGGGGGPTGSAPGPAAPPAAAPPGEPSGGSAFQAWGPSIVDTGLSPIDQSSVARIDARASVVAWAKGASVDGTAQGVLQAQRHDASGNKLGDVIRIAGNLDTGGFSIAPFGNGGWVAAWMARGESGARRIQFQGFTASGEALGGFSGAVAGEEARAPVARATPDGGLVIGWLTDASRAFVARIDGDSTLVCVAHVSDLAGEQDELSVNPLSNGSVLVGWRQFDAREVRLTSTGYTRLLGPGCEARGAERPLIASRDFPRSFTFAPLPADRVAVAWPSPGRLNWQVLDGTGTPLSDAVLVQLSAEQLTQLTAVDAGGGSFDLLFQLSGGSPVTTRSTIMVQRVNASGQAEGVTSVAVPLRRTVGLTQDAGLPAPAAWGGFSVSAAGDGHHVISYHVSTDAFAQIEVLAR